MVYVLYRFEASNKILDCPIRPCVYYSKGHVHSACTHINTVIIIHIMPDHIRMHWMYILYIEYNKYTYNYIILVISYKEKHYTLDVYVNIYIVYTAVYMLHINQCVRCIFDNVYVKCMQCILNILWIWLVA